MERGIHRVSLITAAFNHRGMNMGFFKRRNDKKKLQKVLDDVQEQVSLEEMLEEGAYSIAGRCEQIMGNAREIDDGKKEYHIVTSYLNDIEIIENLASDEAEEIKKTADHVAKLNKARDQFLNTSKKISDAQFKMIQQQEDEIPDAINNLRKNEEYQSLVKRDMQYLEGEKQEWEIQKRERIRQQKTLRRASYFLFSVVLSAAVLLLILSIGFSYDLRDAWIAVIAVAVLCAAVIVVRLENGRLDIRQARANINYAITLLNKVKLKYVSITSAVDYTREKYHVRDAREFMYQWDLYQEAVREQEKYRQTNQDLNYYYDKLVNLLKKCSLYDSRVWIEQPQALIDPKEMVEIKHNLIVRRQKLRSKIAYNLEIVRKERRKIDEMLRKKQKISPQEAELIRTIDQMADLGKK